MKSARWRTRRWLCALVVIVLMIGFLSWRMSPNFGCVAVGTNGPGALLLNINQLARGDAKKYCWKMPDRAETVRFIVARRSDGLIEVVLDACKTCYRNNLGYRISEGMLVCRFCGNRYSLDKLSDGMMSCRALDLPFTVDRGVLRIRTIDLMGRARYFPQPSVANAILTSPFRMLTRLAGANRTEQMETQRAEDQVGGESHRAISTIIDN
jgi:uncharacterized membrane protein